MFPIEVPQIQVHFGIPIFKLSKIIMMIDGYSMSHCITVASPILLVSYVHRCIVFPGHRQRATQDAIVSCFAMNCAFLSAKRSRKQCYCCPILLNMHTHYSYGKIIFTTICIYIILYNYIYMYNNTTQYAYTVFIR